MQASRLYVCADVAILAMNERWVRWRELVLDRVSTIAHRTLAGLLSALVEIQISAVVSHFWRVAVRKFNFVSPSVLWNGLCKVLSRVRNSELYLCVIRLVELSSQLCAVRRKPILYTQKPVPLCGVHRMNSYILAGSKHYETRRFSVCIQKRSRLDPGLNPVNAVHTTCSMFLIHNREVSVYVQWTEVIWYNDGKCCDGKAVSRSVSAACPTA